MRKRPFGSSEAAASAPSEPSSSPTTKSSPIRRSPDRGQALGGSHHRRRNALRVTAAAAPEPVGILAQGNVRWHAIEVGGEDHLGRLAEGVQVVASRLHEPAAGPASPTARRVRSIRSTAAASAPVGVSRATSALVSSTGSIYTLPRRAVCAAGLRKGGVYCYPRRGAPRQDFFMPSHFIGLGRGIGVSVMGSASVHEARRGRQGAATPAGRPVGSGRRQRPPVLPDRGQDRHCQRQQDHGQRRTVPGCAAMPPGSS